MTIDRTRERATNQNELMEGTRDRIILEHKDLQITVISPKTPRNGREGYEMWKVKHQPGQKCAAKNAKCKECHKNRTLPQGMPIQEKRQES